MKKNCEYSEFYECLRMQMKDMTTDIWRQRDLFDSKNEAKVLH